MALTADQQKYIQNILVAFGGMSPEEAAKPENLTRGNVERALANVAAVNPDLAYDPNTGFTRDYSSKLNKALTEISESENWPLFKGAAATPLGGDAFAGTLLRAKFPKAPESLVSNPDILVDLVSEPGHYIDAVNSFFQNQPGAAPVAAEVEPAATPAEAAKPVEPVAQEPAAATAPQAAPQAEPQVKPPTPEEIAAQKATEEAEKKQAEINGAEMMVETGVDALAKMVNEQIKAQTGADLLGVRALNLPDLKNGKLDNRAVQEFMHVLTGPMGLNMGWEDGEIYTPERGKQILERLKNGAAPAFVAKMTPEQQKQYNDMVQGGMAEMFIGSLDKLHTAGLLSDKKEFETSPLGMAPALGQMLGWLKTEWPQVFGIIDGLTEKFGFDLDSLALMPAAPAPAAPSAPAPAPTPAPGTTGQQPDTETASAPGSSLPGGGITITTMVQIDPNKPAPSLNLDFKNHSGSVWTDDQPSNVHPRADLLTQDTALVNAPSAPSELPETAPPVLALSAEKINLYKNFENADWLTPQGNDPLDLEKHASFLSKTKPMFVLEAETEHDGPIERHRLVPKSPVTFSDLQKQLGDHITVEQMAYAGQIYATRLTGENGKTLLLEPESYLNESHRLGVLRISSETDQTMQEIHEIMREEIAAENRHLEQRAVDEVEMEKINAEITEGTREIAAGNQRISEIEGRVSKPNPTPVSAPEGQTTQPSWPGTVQPPMKGEIQNAAPASGDKPNPQPLPTQVTTTTVAYAPAPQETPSLKHHTGHEAEKIHDLAQVLPNAWWDKKWEGKQGQALRDFANAEYKRIHNLPEDANIDMYTKEAFLFVHNNPDVHPRGAALITENRVISDLKLMDHKLASRPQFFVEGKGDQARIIAVGRDRDAHFSNIDVTDDMKAIRDHGHQANTQGLNALRSSAYPYHQFRNTESLYNVAVNDIEQADKKLSTEFKVVASGNYKIENYAPNEPVETKPSRVPMSWAPAA